MRRTITKYYCDLCGVVIQDYAEIKYPIIFHTDQTEGRGCEPYISHERIELCGECMKKVLVLHAWGAQGNNKYEIRYSKKAEEHNAEEDSV
jgi:hypothetical protein